MKKVCKIISLCLCIALLLGIFTGCGNNKMARERGKFTYWAPMWISSTETLKSYSDMMMYQELSKRTGYEIDFIHPTSGSTGSEAFQILLTSTELPDMIEYGWSQYAGGPDRAIEDKVIISLNDYMKEYAPNYYDYMEGEKGKNNGYLYRAQSLTLDGNYYGFRNLNIGDYRGFQGFIVRRDLLDKWGLDVPTTIDDWTNLFKVAKENGIKYPYTGSPHNFATAWNVRIGYMVDDDVIKFGSLEKQFKNYLKQMSDWFKAGYIDRDYVTNESIEIESAMTSGKSIATCGYVGSVMGKILPAMEERDPGFDLVACPWPVVNEGDIPWFQDLQAEANDSTIAISVQCGKDDKQRYIDAIKYCDYLYSEDGMILKSFGIEGVTFNIEKDENGQEHYVYTDKIYNYKEETGANSVDAAIWHYMRPASAPGLNQHNDYLAGMYSYQQQKDALKTFNLYVDEARKHVLPPLQYTSDEVERKNMLEVKAKDKLFATIDNIIMGKQDINSFDDAVKKAKSDGFDEILKIQQRAYDRYIKLLDIK